MEQLIAGYNHRLEHSLLNDSARTSTYDALATYALRTLNVTLRGVPLLLPSQRSTTSINSRPPTYFALGPKYASWFKLSPLKTKINGSPAKAPYPAHKVSFIARSKAGCLPHEDVRLLSPAALVPLSKFVRIHSWISPTRKKE